MVAQCSARIRLWGCSIAPMLAQSGHDCHNAWRQWLEPTCTAPHLPCFRWRVYFRPCSVVSVPHCSLSVGPELKLPRMSGGIADG